MSDLILTDAQIQYIEDNSEFLDCVDMLEHQPDFIQSMGVFESLEEIAAVLQGGCASGAYMPAVTYYTAAETLAKFHDSVEAYINDLKLTWLVADETYPQFAVKAVSIAVEAWCYQFEQLISELDRNGILYN